MPAPNLHNLNFVLTTAAGPNGVSRAELFNRISRSAAFKILGRLMRDGRLIEHKFASGAVRYFRTADQLQAWLEQLSAARTEVRTPVQAPPSPPPPPIAQPAPPARYTVSGLYELAGQRTHCAGTMPITTPGTARPPLATLPALPAPIAPRRGALDAQQIPSRIAGHLVWPDGRREEVRP